MKKVTVENAWFQTVFAIKNNRNKRHKSGTFFVEGIKNINEAIRNNWNIKTIIVKDYEKLSDFAKDIISKNDNAEIYSLSEELMSKISDKDEVSEILLLVEMRERKLEDINIKEDLLVVVCDRTIYPGNLGTIIRSADALKVDALIVTGHSADIYDTATIKGSVGSIFKLPIYKLESDKDMVPFIDSIKYKHNNLKIVGTTAKTEKYITDEDYKCPLILLIGNETSGLSKGYKELCNTMVKIPMYGVASSYNVGCATSIMLYEVDRQRRI